MGKPAGDALAAAAPYDAEIGGAAGNRKIEPIALKHLRLPWPLRVALEPRCHHFKQTLSKNRRFEQAAVEQHEVGPGRIVLCPRQLSLLQPRVAMSDEELRQVLGNRGIRRIRQAEFLKAGMMGDRLVL